MSVEMLQQKIRKKKNPTAVGLDLRPELLPPALLEEAFSAHGKTPAALAAAYQKVGIALLDVLAAVVPAVKFNTAFFDALGADGTLALQALCAHAKKLDLYVILETMRSDVELAAELCAKTYFGALDIGGEPVRLYDVDALCIGAFLGSDGMKPYLPYCRTHEKSVFVLAKTSNKSAREVQDLISGDRVIHTVMTDLVVRWSRDLFAKSGYSELGVVVGATQPNDLRELRRRYDRLFFLVPGYGAQGGSAKDVQYAFDRFGHGAVVAASRSILGAWQKTGGDGSDYVERAYDAAVKMKNDLARYVVVM